MRLCCDPLRWLGGESELVWEWYYYFVAILRSISLVMAR
jgi:hypothetical protein